MQKKTILRNRFLRIFLFSLVLVFSLSFLVPHSSHAASRKPSKVTITSVKSTGYNSIQIKWKKASYAKKYEIYRASSKNGTYKKIKTTTSTSYTNTKLTTGKKYYYKVRAVNGSKKGTFSAKKYAIPKLSTTKVSSLTSTENTVKIKYSKISGAKGYQIYRSTSKNGSYKKVASTTSTSFTDKKLTRNKGYYYKIRSYRKVGSRYKYSNFSSAKYIKTKNHTYKAVVTKPTCSKQGYTTYICKYCGKSYKNKYTEATNKHNWIEHSDIVHHEAVYESQWIETKEAWDEEIPVYERLTRSICNGCGEDITNNTTEHTKNAMLNGNTACGGYHTETREVQTGTTIVHHEAEGYYEDVLVQEAWDEVVSVVSKCSVCGMVADHLHNWEAQYETVHHEAVYETQWVETKAAWDEEVPVYERLTRAICNGCGEDITGSTDVHMENAMLNGNAACGGYHTEIREVQTDITIVHHEAEGQYEEVLVQEAWNEDVYAGYKCSECGTTK